jgi:hypothetical protein
MIVLLGLSPLFVVHVFLVHMHILIMNVLIRCYMCLMIMHVT